jgi:hypothetical protein
MNFASAIGNTPVLIQAGRDDPHAEEVAAVFDRIPGPDKELIGTTQVTCCLAIRRYLSFSPG